MAKKNSKTQNQTLLVDVTIDANKSFALQMEDLHQAVANVGLQARKGFVVFAGRVADGTTRVQFNVNSDGWSSPWPEWAFTQAQLALVNNLPLWVISNGVPFGPNLLQVHVVHRNG
jgi:hypothetical protein